MTSESDDPTIDDPRFASLLASCLEAVERGEPIDGDRLRRECPEYADRILEFLDLQSELREVGGVEASSNGTSARQTGVCLSSPSINGQPPLRVRYFGDYLLLEEVGRGGMGVVYKGRQQRLGRIVAVKMILTGHLANELDVRRFEREARAAANLAHPNIVSVHEVGEHDGHHFFSMDYIDGENLSTLLRERPLPTRRAAEVVSSVARAIDYSHQQGTLHRDLKPSNILFDRGGVPHITDFGLAKLVERDLDEVELTTTGQVIGTPSYMSPEQAASQHDLVGPASDIYSLGTILYASLTSRPPFAADSVADTLHQVIYTDPVAPRLLNPDIPRDLETICLKCLAKEPHRRYSTAAELADDLDRFLAGRPVVARPISLVSRGVRWCRRNKPIAGLLTLIALILVLSGYALRTMTSRVDRIDALLDPHREQLALYASEQAQQTSEDERLAMNEVLQQQRLGFNSKLLLLPGARHLVLAHNDATLQVVETETGQTIKTVRGLDGPANCLAFGAGAQSVYVGTDLGSIYRCDLQGDETLKVYDTDGWSVDSLAASADGRFIAWATNGRQGRNKSWEKPPESACVLSTTTGEKLFGIAGGRSDWQALSFSHDGSFIAIIISREVVIVDTASGEIQRRLRLPDYESGPLSVAVSPTQPLVAIGYAPSDLALWDLTTQEFPRVLDAHTNWVVSLSFTADGRQLVSSAGDGTASVWHVATGEEVGRKRFPVGATYAYVNSVSTAGDLVAMGTDEEYVVSRLPNIGPE